MENNLNTAPSFLFLGTGASDWQKPEPSGESRAFSSMLAFKKLLFDCSAHVPGTLEKHKIPLSAIDHILITHSHRDHFNVEAIKCILDSRPIGTRALVYTCAAVAETLRSAGIEVREVEPFRAFNAGEFSIVPIAANHIVTDIEDEIPLHYIVNLNTYSWLYAVDGAWLPYASWKVLRGWKLDALIIDATIGDGHEGDHRIFEHNSLPMIRIMVETMKKTEVLTPDTPVILTHLARTLHPDQKTLEQSLKEPFIVAYDGMEL